MSGIVRRVSATSCTVILSRALVLIGPLLLGLTQAQVATAGVYTDDLSKCLVSSSDSKDRVTLVQWMFAALTLHPAVQPLTSMSEEQRHAITKDAVAIFSRLLTVSCRKETVAALKYEGASAVGASFQVLGQVASRDLMTEPHVAAAMRDLGHDLGEDQKLKDLLKDAGLGTSK